MLDQARTEAENIRIGKTRKWDKRHPEYADFTRKLPVIEKIAALAPSLRGMDEAERDRIMSVLGADITEDDMLSHRAYQAHQRDEMARFSTADGRREMIRDMIREEAGDVYGAQRQEEQNYYDYTQLYKENEELVKANYEYLDDQVRRGADPYAVIDGLKAQQLSTSHAQLLKEVETLRAESKAKQSASKGSAVQTRDSDIAEMDQNAIYSLANEEYVKRFGEPSNPGYTNSPQFLEVLDHLITESQK